ncbi:MAG: PAS domain S-box protein [Polyangia bacterium]
MADFGVVPETAGQQDGPAGWDRAGTDQLFRLLVSAVWDYAIIALDARGRVLTWNTGARRLYGYRPEEIVGRPVSRLYTQEDRDARHLDDELRTAREAGSFHEEGWRVRRDGSRFWASVAITRIDGDDGELLGFAKITRDMTDKQQAQEAELERQRRELELAQLREREEQLHMLANSIPQLAWIADETGDIFWYNRRWYEYTGMTADQMKGAGWQRVHHPAELARVVDGFNRAVAAGEAWEDTFPIRNRTGEWRWFLSRAVPIRGADGRIFRWLGSNTDVTEQVELARQRDRLLKDVDFERARFEAVMNQMPAAVIVGEAPSGKLVFANSRMDAVWGHPLIQSESIDDYARWGGFHPDGRPYAPDEWPLARAIQRGEIVDAEEVAIDWPDGQRRWLRLSAAPVRAADGQILAGVVLCQDITDEKTAHRQLAESEARFRALTEELERTVAHRTQELLAANKELEAFSYSVSHDLRAPLRAIDGFSKALAEDYAALLPADAKELLSDVRQAAQRMAGLIDDLLRLSRVTRAPLTRTRVDLTRLAETVTADLRRGDPERDVTVHIQAGVTAEADEALIRVALENLFGNAWKFTARQPHPEIWFGSELVDGTQAFFVRDNGAGFDMAYGDKLFVSFQRLHANSEFPGTGIGLATVQRVVRRHGGRAWAVGEPGRGATFSFTLDGGGATS